MAYKISREKLEDLEKYYRNDGRLRWPSVFVLPGWLEAWWSVFGEGYEPLVLSLWDADALIGIAPLKVKDGVASFIGDNSVCDYLDFIVVPGREENFSLELLNYLRVVADIRILKLETLRPEAVALNSIVEGSGRSGGMAAYGRINVSFEMELPDRWEAFLGSLDPAQRRDAERKMRQLGGVAEVKYTVLRDDEVGQAELDTFFGMMAESRSDKAQFLTGEMRSFFQKLASAMASYGALRLGFLDVGVARVAGILYFDYNDRIFLYNSGYAPQYAVMDAGLVSKLYCIRRAIEDRKRVFDFLKGPEVYKSRLGGREVGLSRCVIDFR